MSAGHHFAAVKSVQVWGGQRRFSIFSTGVRPVCRQGRWGAYRVSSQYALDEKKKIGLLISERRRSWPSIFRVCECSALHLFSETSHLCSALLWEPPLLAPCAILLSQPAPTARRSMQCAIIYDIYACVHAYHSPTLSQGWGTAAGGQLAFITSFTAWTLSRIELRWAGGHIPFYVINISSL